MKKLTAPAVLSTQEEHEKYLESLFGSFPMQGHRDDDGTGTFKTGVACRIPGCGGEIAREVKRVYRGDPMHAIIGPGYENQLTSVTKLYCPVCRVMYNGLPEKK